MIIDKYDCYDDVIDMLKYFDDKYLKLNHIN